MAAQKATQVIGVGLPEQTAVAFKKEAASRNLGLNEIFQEMWELYWQKIEQYPARAP